MAERTKYASYLGDGVYVDFDGYAIILTTEDGFRATNLIVLEPEVYQHLGAWVVNLRKQVTLEYDRSHASEASDDNA